MFDPEHSSGPSETGHDFVGNQQRIGTITPFTHGPQGPAGPKLHPSAPLNEPLDHYGGNLRQLPLRKTFQGPYVRNLNRGKTPVAGPDMEQHSRDEAGRAS